MTAQLGNDGAKLYQCSITVTPQTVFLQAADSRNRNTVIYKELQTVLLSVNQSTVEILYV